MFSSRFWLFGRRIGRGASKACLLACLLTCVLYTLYFLPSPLLLLVLEHGLRLRPFLFIK